MRMKSLEELELDDEHKMGFTFKTAAAGVVAMRAHGLDFRRVVCSIAGEGGDADTNCAVAGALVGAAVGYAALPTDWLAQMPHGDWLHC